MDVTKYADLSQSLAESEKLLYDKISEECASNFEIAIHDSLTEIKGNAELMTEVVNKIQSCKDSYGEAADLVGKLSTTLIETEENVTGLNFELAKVGEQASSSASVLSEKVASLLVASDELKTKNKENEVVIEEACRNIKKHGDEYSSTVELILKDAKGLNDEISSLGEKITDCITKFSAGSSFFSSKTDIAIDLLNDVLTRFETLKNSLELLFGSVNETKDKLIVVTDNIGSATDKIDAVSNSFAQMEESVDDYNKRVIAEIEEHLNSLKNETEVIVSQSDKFSELLLQNATDVSELIEYQKSWKKSCEDSFADIARMIDSLLSDLEEKQRAISSETKTIQNCETVIESCVNNVKKCTEDYVETVKEANSELMESFELFKNDFITTYNEQSKMIGELKEEQLKLKKMYLLGIIPVAIIIVLQIISIMC